MNRKTKSNLKKRFYSYFREAHLEITNNILQRIADDIELYTMDIQREKQEMQKTLEHRERIIKRLSKNIEALTNQK